MSASSLALEGLDVLYSDYVSKNLFDIGWCPVEMNVLTPKIGTFQMSTKITVSLKRLQRF
jgi:hypothetical protein